MNEGPQLGPEPVGYQLDPHAAGRLNGAPESVSFNCWRGVKMALSGRDLVDHINELMSEKDVEALGDLYAADAQMVLYYRVASGRDEIRRLLASSLESHGVYDVISVDQFQDTGDIVMWDATVERDAGILEATHILILDTDGLIHRHIPRIRGYWGM
jgi:hypothetical protein